MSNITIKEILSLADGTLLDSLQCEVKKVFKQREVKGGKTVQDAMVRDGTGAEVKIAVWDHPPIDTYEGRQVIIQSGPKGGLKVVLDTYNNKNINYVSVSKTGTFQFLEVHQAQTGGAGAPATNGHPMPAPVGSGASSGACSGNSGTIVVNGAKVGMTLNNACQFLIGKGEA